MDGHTRGFMDFGYFYETNIVQQGSHFPALVRDTGPHLLSCKDSATQNTKVNTLERLGILLHEKKKAEQPNDGQANNQDSLNDLLGKKVKSAQSEDLFDQSFKW